MLLFPSPQVCHLPNSTEVTHVGDGSGTDDPWEFILLFLGALMTYPNAYLPYLFLLGEIALKHVSSLFLQISGKRAFLNS